jgi:DNA-binding LacI/PurR family transcriptional regulator
MRPGMLSPEILAVARQLRNRSVPVVAYGYAGALGFDSVTSDHAAGCEELCNWLIQQGKRRILRVWEHPLGTEIPEWRKQRDLGYENALRAAGLEVLPYIEIPALPEVAIQTRQDFEMRARLILGYLWEHFNGPAPADAILALTDGATYPITAACRLLGKQPNRDVTIVGYDNYWQDSPHRQWESTRPAATVDKLNLDLGQELMNLLQSRLEGKLPPEPQLRLIKPELLITPL